MYFHGREAKRFVCVRLCESARVSARLSESLRTIICCCACVCVCASVSYECVGAKERTNASSRDLAFHGAISGSMSFNLVIC